MSDDEIEDRRLTPFSWQNEKHYRDLKKNLQALSEQQLNLAVQVLSKSIRLQKTFFKQCYDNLLSHLSRTIYEWMMEDVLTMRNFDLGQSSVREDTASDEDEDEDAWRTAYQRGYDGTESEYDEDYISESSVESEWDATSSENEEDFQESFERWQLQKLNDTLEIDLESMDDFTVDIIDINAMKRFLKENVEGHPRKNYSWLLNQIIEGDLSASEDFVHSIRDSVKELGFSSGLLHDILGGLWFDYDWEEFDIADHHFLERTYIRTLQRFVNGTAAKDVKKSIQARLRDLFSFNADRFPEPFKKIKEEYNSCAKNGDWKNALVIWSVYTAFQKIYGIQSAQIQPSTSLISSLPKIMSKPFSNERYLLKDLEKSLARAKVHYTKVYPHRDTKYLTYTSQHNHFKNATLDLAEVFSRLQDAGRRIKALKPRGSENIFVPTLVFVVSNQPHKATKKDRDHSRIFIEIPFKKDLMALNHPLTCSLQDGIFASEEEYRQKDQKNVERGLKIIGAPQNVVRETLEEAAKRSCSERVAIESFHHPQVPINLCQALAEQLAPYGEGIYKIYSVALLAYSTNTVCQHCTPALLALQNSCEQDGFLGNLVNALNSYNRTLSSSSGGGIQFKTRGYDQANSLQDYSKFHLTTFVKADINCGAQADDLADKGQHQHRKCKNPPETHNPHAKLFFPKDNIDLHAPLLCEEQPSPLTGFFYEFMDEQNFMGPSFVQAQENTPFTGMIFSSGPRSWV
ncbi:MAG: hypothetical protein NT128_02180 [Proteobacteria bacterium]|nr:hypothetical protein [Pseudomonadota bacterium]